MLAIFQPQGEPLAKKATQLKNLLVVYIILWGHLIDKPHPIV